MYGIRDDGMLFGRQILTVWGGQFSDQYRGTARELPGHGGYMYSSIFNVVKVRVECPSPRTADNYMVVDAMLSDAIGKARQESSDREAKRRSELDYRE